MPRELTNVYSQFGEDAVIESIFKLLPPPREFDNARFCVEFGAWDGLHLSNTANLILNQGWEGLLIEADSKRFKELQLNFIDKPVKCVKSFVNFEGNSSLDEILEQCKVKTDFDLLSIDIDGNDYWIFDSLTKYKPKVIVIEFNPTIPNSVSFINPKDMRIKQGSSLKAINELAHKKGYVAIATTLCNVFLIDLKYLKHFQDEILPIDSIHEPTLTNKSWIGFDGTLFFEKEINFLWHGIVTPSAKLQPIPKVFRRFPEDFTSFQTFCWKAWSLLMKLRKK